jgi:hypothetical protein
MIGDSCPVEIQHFPSLANAYLFAHENLEKYRILFTSDYSLMNPHTERRPGTKPYDSSLFSKNPSPATIKEKAVLYDYLIASNEDFSCTDDLPPPATEHTPSSETKKILPEVPPNTDSPEYLDLQDSQDPYEDFDDDHKINWEGCGLFWDIPFSHEYYQYHNNT